jgi:hypothetical protein
VISTVVLMVAVLLLLLLVVVVAVEEETLEVTAIGASAAEQVSALTSFITS